MPKSEPLEDSSSDDDCYGPALPPNFKPRSHEDTSADAETSGNSNQTKVIGPSLPPSLAKILRDSNEDEEPNCSTIVTKGNDELHAHVESEHSSSDDDVVGPLPADHPRALEKPMRSHSSGGDEKDSKKLKREEWMLIPPKNKSVAEIGFGPRKFLMRAPEEPALEEDEDSNNEESLEKQMKESLANQCMKEYDEKMDQLKNDGKKRSGESLLEIHRREMKKKKAESSDVKKERRPFDRNVDLKISNLSREDKNKFIEKSHELDSRFSKGRQKYL